MEELAVAKKCKKPYKAPVVSKHERPKKPVINDSVPMTHTFSITTSHTIINGTTTIIFFENLKGKPEKCVVRCHEEDTFDADKGKKIAVLKAMKREIEKVLREI